MNMNQSPFAQNQVQFYDSPSNKNIHFSDTFTPNQRGNAFRNVRNEILEECNSQYKASNENNSSHLLDNSQQNTPFQQRSNQHSKSPHNNKEYQGLNQQVMTKQEIINKQAFVWGFGKNQEGELALGKYKDSLLPSFANLSQVGTVKQIASSNHHTAIINSRGQLYVCGSSLHGKLGIDELNKTNINKLQQVSCLKNKKVKQIACGDYHTLCLLEDCTVLQFGGSLLKDKQSKNKTQNLQQSNPSQPQPIQSLYGKDIIYIDSGDFHSAALDANGDLYTWGGGQSSYNKGQCGHGHTQFIDQPQKVEALENKRIVQVACGGFHTLALTSENELYAFGSGVYGECGYGEFQDTPFPKLVQFPNEYPIDNEEDDDPQEHGIFDMCLQEQQKIKQIAAGGKHSLVLTNDGKLYSFGYGQNGQLGQRNSNNLNKPQIVSDLLGKSIKAIAAGQNHSLALSKKGNLYTCGHGLYGQLGLGSKELRTSFTYVKAIGNMNVIKIFAGGNHSWVQIDDVIPIRENYQEPSPTGKYNKNRSSSNTPLRKSDLPNRQISTISSGKKHSNIGRSTSPFQKTHSILKENHQKILGQSQSKNDSDKNYNQGDDMIGKIIEVQQQALQNAQFFVQITYCETEFCHRFINFELHHRFIKQAEELLHEYIQQSQKNEKGVLFHRIQEIPNNYISQQPTPGERLMKEVLKDDEQSDQDQDENKDEEEEYLSHSKSFTLCTICNPNECDYDQIYQEQQSYNESNKSKKVVINSSGLNQDTYLKTVPKDENQQHLLGKIVFIKDSDIKKNEFEQKMCDWVYGFHCKLAKYCVKKPRYSELRPMKYYY